ncbi:MAG: TIR protein [uncultured Thiotrichaceae bacterium]|uniref:TIR protein n=1 Tax=uncultured Thiotrichaceae bacterium TaxID=298394 RepID=A0A6S6TUW2_9GAMM|nr:MAG: TIR protein [uncultured Thiotrichaceae bacterium]
MSDIFISYSRKDKPWVEKLASSLEAEGYDVWWDPEILPGQDFETVIRQSLEGAKCVITVWSQSSISSHWVKEESSYALERRVLVPVLYQAIKPPMPFGRIHTADLQGWKGKTSDPRYQQLLRAIAVHCPVDLVDPPLHQSSTTKTKKPWLGIASGLLLLGVAGYFGLSYLPNDGNSNTQSKQSVLMANVDQGDIQNQEINPSNKAAIEAQQLKQQQVDEEKKIAAAKKAEDERLAKEKQAEEEAKRIAAEKKAQAEAEAKRQTELDAANAEREKLKALLKTEQEKNKKAEEQARIIRAEAAKQKAAKKAEEATSQSKDTRIGQYVDHGDGTVTDTKTKLMWKKCSEGQSGINCGQGKAKKFTWDYAMKQFENVEFAGYRDWRMPTREELRSLVYCSNGVSQEEAWDGGCDGKNDDQGKYDRPTIDQSVFPRTQTWYWSSSPYASSSNGAWIVGFNYGGGHWYNKGNNFYVRLVRSGQ